MEDGVGARVGSDLDRGGAHGWLVNHFLVPLDRVDRSTRIYIGGYDSITARVAV